MSLEGWAALFKYVGWVGAGLVLLSTIATTLFNDKISGLKDASSAEKDKRIDQLLVGQSDLTSSVQKYQEELRRKQAEIDDLSRRASNSERGIRSSYDFDGTCRTQSGSSFTTMVGINTQVFQKLCDLNNHSKWDEVIFLASSVIEKNKDWLTPYYLRGVAYSNIGNLQGAEADLRYVAARAGDDKDYAQAGAILSKLQQHRQHRQHQGE